MTFVKIIFFRHYHFGTCTVLHVEWHSRPRHRVWDLGPGGDGQELWPILGNNSFIWFHLHTVHTEIIESYWIWLIIPVLRWLGLDCSWVLATRLTSFQQGVFSFIILCQGSVECAFQVRVVEVLFLIWTCMWDCQKMRHTYHILSSYLIIISILSSYLIIISYHYLLITTFRGNLLPTIEFWGARFFFTNPMWGPPCRWMPVYEHTLSQWTSMAWNRFRRSLCQPKWCK